MSSLQVQAIYRAAHRGERAAYMQAWRAQHKDRYAAYRVALRDKGNALSDLLKVGPCSDCGDAFPPECMDWDHRPGEPKFASVSRLRRGGPARFLAEIAKCDLVCANCHRTRTKNRKAA